MQGHGAPAGSPPPDEATRRQWAASAAAGKEAAEGRHRQDDEDVARIRLVADRIERLVRAHGRYTEIDNYIERPDRARILAAAGDEAFSIPLDSALDIAEWFAATARRTGLSPDIVVRERRTVFGGWQKKTLPGWQFPRGSSFTKTYGDTSTYDSAAVTSDGQLFLTLTAGSHEAGHTLRPVALVGMARMLAFPRPLTRHPAVTFDADWRSNRTY
jgi:hypothetical protein